MRQIGSGGQRRIINSRIILSYQPMGIKNDVLPFQKSNPIITFTSFSYNVHNTINIYIILSYQPIGIKSESYPFHIIIISVEEKHIIFFIKSYQLKEKYLIFLVSSYQQKEIQRTILSFSYYHITQKGYREIFYLFIHHRISQTWIKIYERGGGKSKLNQKKMKLKIWRNSSSISFVFTISNCLKKGYCGIFCDPRCATFLIKVSSKTFCAR